MILHVAVDVLPLTDSITATGTVFWDLVQGYARNIDMEGFCDSDGRQIEGAQAGEGGATSEASSSAKIAEDYEDVASNFVGTAFLHRDLKSSDLGTNHCEIAAHGRYDCITYC